MKTYDAKTKLLFFLTFFFYFINSYGQSAVYHYQTPEIDYSIIREYTGDISIIYLHTTTDQGYFIYDSYSGGGTTNPVLPINSPYRINDFRIMDDTIFLCGVIDTAVLFGKIAISDLNSPLATETLWHCTLSGKDSLAAWKMEVYRLNGSAHIAATGQYKDLANPQQLYSTIYEFIDNGPYNSVCNMFMTYEVDRRYTDITVTDSHVVAVSNGKYTNFCHLHPFMKTPYFLNFPLYAGHYFEISDVTTEGNILIEQYFKDTVLIANHFSSSNIFGTTLKRLFIQNSSPYISVSNSLLMPHIGAQEISSKWVMRELAVNKPKRSAALLENAFTNFHPETESTIFEYDVEHWNTMNIIASWIKETNFYSIHKSSAYGFQTVGKYTIDNGSMIPTYYWTQIYKKSFSFLPSCAMFNNQINYYDNTTSVKVTTPLLKYNIANPTVGTSIFKQQTSKWEMHEGCIE